LAAKKALQGSQTHHKKFGNSKLRSLSHRKSPQCKENVFRWQYVVDIHFFKGAILLEDFMWDPSNFQIWSSQNQIPNILLVVGTWLHWFSTPIKVCNLKPDHFLDGIEYITCWFGVSKKFLWWKSDLFHAIFHENMHEWIHLLFSSANTNYHRIMAEKINEPSSELPVHSDITHIWSMTEYTMSFPHCLSVHIFCNRQRTKD
jgi:hypothetical protein